MKIPVLLLALAAGLGPTLALRATENGTTAFPNGGEDFLVAAMPPPGWYGLTYLNRYDARELAGPVGPLPLADFHFTVDAVVPRLDWVKPASWLGADRWGTLLLLPLLDLDLTVSPTPGTTVRAGQSGCGDLTIGNGLHWTMGDFEMVNAFDVVVPLGKYDEAAAVNPGQNRWVVRVSHMGTWHPTPAWDVSYRLHWDHNFENQATGYDSGDTLYLNWAAGWKPQPALTIGLAGYFLRQISDDHWHGAVVGPDGNRIRANGVGPAVKYFFPNHVMLTAKYFREFDVRHRPQGEQFWLYVAVPLGAPRH